MTRSLFRSPEARATMERWYERFHAKLRVPTESRVVPTRFGDTHVLLAGPADAPPLVVLHGALAGAPHVLGEVEPLARRFRLIVPDIVGPSVKSAQTLPPVDDDSYGRWLVDVLDALGVARVHLYAASWGGLVALRTVQAAPTRIDRLVLLVPAGIVRGGAKDGLLRVLLPMMLYRAFPSPERLRAFARHQFTTLDSDWTAFIGDAVRCVRLDFRMPKDATAEAFAAFEGPVYAIGVDDDVHFPGPALLARARTLFRNLAREELLADCKHSPPFDDAFREALCGRVAAFLAAD